MVRTTVKCKLENAEIPRYATLESAGADAVANEDVMWQPIYSEPIEIFDRLNIPAINDSNVKGLSETVRGINPLYKSMQIIVGWKAIVSTGLFLEIPKGYEIQVRPRSGLAFKHNVTVINAPGTVDSDYRGEVKVAIMVAGALDKELAVTDNNGNFIYSDDPETVAMETYPILPKGTKIAQLVLARVEQARYVLSEKLNSTSRGANGFGSTGLKAEGSTKVEVEFKVGDINVLNATETTIAKFIQSLEQYNKDIKGLDFIYDNNVADDRMLFVTYDVYEFDYSKQDLVDILKSTIDLLGGRDVVERAYQELPPIKKPSY